MAQSDRSRSSSDQAFASFFSALELRDLAAPGNDQAAPKAEGRFAAALFTDLVGFTALAEELSRQGPKGAEELSRLVDEHFGRLTEIVRADGGDVLFYAGDAAMVTWIAADEAGLPEVTARATQCALRLQQRLAASATGGLRMRASIGAGDLTYMRVGGLQDRWLFLSSGGAIEQALRADSAAAPGDVVLSPEAATSLESIVGGTRLSGGALRVGQLDWLTTVVDRAESVAQIPDARLRSMVPESVAARVDAGLEGWIGEFRRVTMVFCGLGGLDPASKDGLAAVHAAVLSLQRGVARYEGAIYQLLTDDKGTTLVAAFGLPPHAHEDDAARGTLAALDMKDRLAGLGLRGAMGVATGLVYAGLYGTAHRRQYTVAGPPVILAARLMQQAGDSVLCDDATRTRAIGHGTLRFDSLPSLELKGYVGQVPVHRPRRSDGSTQEERAETVRDVPVGRAHECAMLLEALAETRTGRGGVVFLEGEPGIGKSCLLEYARSVALGDGIRVLRGVADETEKSTAYHAWRPILRKLAGTDPALIASRLGFRPEQSDLLPLLSALLGMSLGSSDLIAQMSDEVRTANIRELMLQGLANAAASDPLMVTIEDVHWLDSASWTLLLAAARNLPEIRLLITSRRPDDPDSQYTSLCTLAGPAYLPLAPLAPEAVDALLAARLGVSRLPESLLQLVRQRAAGNPFFAEELAYALRDYGLISISAGRCEMTDDARDLQSAFAEALSTRGLPATMQGVVTSRIDRLSQFEQFTLRVASVIGPRFDAQLLSEVHPSPAVSEQLDGSLALLERLDIIRRESNSPGQLFTFRHAITHQVAYDLTPFAQRRDLHRAVGEWFEARYQDDPSPVLPLLAHHWRRAEDTSKAVHYLGRAGEQAFHGYAHAEAVAFLSDALALGRQAPAAERSRWELRAGRACVSWSRYHEGQRHIERGLALIGERIPHGPISLTAQLLGQTARQVLHRAVPGRFVGRSTKRREVLLEAARSHEALVEAFYLMNQSLPCLHSALRSLNLAEMAGPSPELARGYSTVGAILGFIPLYGAADAYCRRALDMARQVGDTPAAVWVALGVGVYKIGVAAWPEALGLLGQVMSEADRLGDARRAEDGAQNLAAIHFHQGNLSEALELAGRMRASAIRRSDPRVQASGVQRRLHCLLMLGRNEDVQEGLDEIASLRWEGGAVNAELPVLTLRALAAARQGDAASAWQSAAAAAEMLAKSTPAFHEFLLDAAGITDVLLELQQTAPTVTEPAILRRALHSSVGALGKFARIFPIGRPYLALHRGRMRWQANKRAAAFADWQRAATLARDLGMPYPEALAQSELVRNGWGTRAEQDMLFLRAQQLFTAIGASRELGLLEQAVRL